MQPQSNSTAMQTQQPQNAQNAQNANSRTAPALLPPVDTWIWRGFDDSRFGTTTFSTPLR